MADRETNDVGLLLARVLLGAVFVATGVYKLRDVAGLAADLEAWNFPLTHATAWAVALFETLGGLALIVGLRGGWVALALALYLVPATLIFHTDFDNVGQVTHLIKNAGLIGGLLGVWATRGGRLRLL